SRRTPPPRPWARPRASCPSSAALAASSTRPDGARARARARARRRCAVLGAIAPWRSWASSPPCPSVRPESAFLRGRRGIPHDTPGFPALASVAAWYDHRLRPRPGPPPSSSRDDMSPRARQVLAIALPIIGGMTSQNILNLVDTAMVGSLGDEALAAVGTGSFANFLAMAFITGLSAGVQTIAS